MSESSESYAARAAREGPLPGVDDDSELIGENNAKGIPEDADARPRENGEVAIVGVGQPRAAVLPVRIDQGRSPAEADEAHEADDDPKDPKERDDSAQ